MAAPAAADRDGPAAAGPGDPVGEQEFARLMAPLGPWPTPGSAGAIAVAVSGGADSTALAVLAADWTRARGLGLLALVVDHRLRAGSGHEAGRTIARLGTLGIAARLIALDGLEPGPGLAERARIARYRALTEAGCRAGCVDLLLGHHAGDQAETVLMRRRAASGPDGLAGMAALLETDDLRLLRPLLALDPARLRALLAARGIGWIEDPSNQDQAAERSRLRGELARQPPALRLGLLAAAAEAGLARMGRQPAAAQALLAASLRPEGFALLPAALLPAPAMAALIRTIGGAPYRPRPEALDRLLRRPHAATLAGTRLVPAGRLGPGWLLLREAAAIGPPVAAIPGAIWDRRYRLVLAAGSLAADLAGVQITPLGRGHRPMQTRSGLPAAVLETLPALRRDGTLLAVPHLAWRSDPAFDLVRLEFQPPSPATESAIFTAG